MWLWFWRKRKRDREQARASTNQMLITATVVPILQEELERQQYRHRGSIFGRQVIHRDRFIGHRKIKADYFDPNLVYDDNIFCWRLVFVLVFHMVCWCLIQKYLELEGFAELCLHRKLHFA